MRHPPLFNTHYKWTSWENRLNKDINALQTVLPVLS